MAGCQTAGSGSTGETADWPEPKLFRMLEAFLTGAGCRLGGKPLADEAAKAPAGKSAADESSADDDGSEETEAAALS